MNAERSRGTNTSGAGRWLSVAVVIDIAIASLLPVSQPAHADVPLTASLEYAFLAQPYDNTIQLNLGGVVKRVAVDRDPSSPYYGTIYAVGGGCESPEMTLQRSFDGGRTFDGPLSFDLASANLPACRAGLSIGVGNRGIVYVAGNNTVWRSTDRGTSWQTAATFGNGGHSVSLVTDGATGAVYAGSVNSTGALLVSSSRDEGGTWSSPIVVAGGAAAAVPAIAALQDSVLVAFLSGDDPPASITVAASHDGGRTWPIVTILSSGTQCWRESPSVSVSPEGIFAVSWYSAVDGCPGEGGGNMFATFVSTSRDQGTSFSAPVEVRRYPGGYGNEFGGALVFDDRSRLFVTWHTAGVVVNGTPVSSVYVGYTTDLGNFTDASFRLSFEGGGANASGFENLAAGTNGSVYLAWEDFRVGRGGSIRRVSGEASGDVVPATQLVPGTVVDVELVEPTKGAVQAQATWTDSPLVLDEVPPNLYEVWIRLGNASARAGVMPVRTWNTTAFTIHVQGGPTSPGPPPFPWITAAFVGGIVFVATAAFVAVQHTRLAREQVLQRRVRLLIYNAISAHPGISFTEVRDGIGLHNGVAAYHLGVLEKQGLIHSERGRRHRWYYPNGDVSLWRERPLSSLQRALLESVRQVPGIGIRELSRSLNRHHGPVSYNVKDLVREGFLRTQRMGRKVLCFPADERETA